ncbi:ABC transporter substrate-binding protein [Actinoallomurus sp. NBC_01490]|jgi:NitT/TauT family transport system substrate-binding protein|uniref:ABC transporter substrate-binding protein n=1 Tax=Actinoallomurus sp. NBC_01490 TaxID=2903557 RepID=UPI002E37A428|nr:ABC transporter substrate-binding protein [Actinoallomurus sp. NBC_01490]
MKSRFAALGLAVLAGTGLLAACGGSGKSSGGDDTQVRLGFFPNITHATALVGVQKGFYTKYLGKAPKTLTFNAGPAATEAVFSGAVDATYVGPNPAINAYAKSHGQAIKVIAGAASGGASLIVKPGIKSAADLRGKKIATPQLGNTQDVALRYWLKQQGLRTDKNGGGDVHIMPQDNSQTLQSFEQNQIDGAWVPEPYASRLILEGKGKKLVDETSLWPGGKFVVTLLIVRTEFQKEHPDLVKKLLQAQVESTDYINSNKPDAEKAANTELQALTGKPLKQEVLDSTFKNVTFTDDPIASSLNGSAQHAEQVGLLDHVDLKGIFDLGPLNEVLKAKGEPAVSSS